MERESERDVLKTKSKYFIFACEICDWAGFSYDK
jgi:hypothetical protein